MKKLYFIAPLAALLGFVVLYLHHADELARQQLQQTESNRQAHEVQLRQEASDRLKTQAELAATQERQQREREAQDARRREEQSARQRALDTLAQAQADQIRISAQVDRLRQEVALRESDLTRLQADRASLTAGRARLAGLLAATEANRRALTATLEQPAPVPTGPHP